MAAKFALVKKSNGNVVNLRSSNTYSDYENGKEAGSPFEVVQVMGGDVNAPNFISDTLVAGKSRVISGTDVVLYASGVPAAPTNLVLTQLTNTSIRVAWTDNSGGLARFNVYVAVGQNAPKPAYRTRELNEGVVTADFTVTADTVYRVWVEAFNYVGVSTSINKHITVMDVPGTLTITANSNAETELLIGWTDLTPLEDGFNVYIDTANVRPNLPTYQVAAGVQSKLAVGLTGGTLYYVWVTAYKTNQGESPAVTGFNKTSLLAPTGLTATVNGSEQITLNWDNNSANDTLIDIFIDTVNVKPAVPIYIEAAAVNSKVVNAGLVSDTTYYFWVECKNAIQRSAADDVSAKTYKELNGFFLDGGIVTGDKQSALIVPFALTVKGIGVKLATAPTGSTAIFDIDKNAGGSLWTVAGDKPTVAIGSTAFNPSGTADSGQACVAGDTLWLNVDQVGSTIAGSDLSVKIYY